MQPSRPDFDVSIPSLRAPDPAEPSDELADADTEAARRLERRQALRRFVLGLAGLSYAIDAVMLVLLSLAGAGFGPSIGLGYGLIAAVGNLVFFVVIRRGRNLALRDPDLTLPQVVLGYGLKLAVLAIAPGAALVALLGTFIVASFAALTMTRAALLSSWAVVSALGSIIVALQPEPWGPPLTTPTLRALVWLLFVLALARVVVIGSRITTLRERLHLRNRALALSVERTRELANIDELTRVFNRRAFSVIARDEMRRASGEHHPLCVATFDIDHFKAINDTHGHPVGDSVLVEVAARIRDEVRGSDRVARFGGEEFVVLLPDTPIDDATRVAERVRRSMERSHWYIGGSMLSVTVSAGVAELAPGDVLPDLLARSDAALYEAKRTGRNRTITSPNARPKVSPPAGP